ncbi:MAG: radical SAM protein [Elusimicrobia bacterium]|nr:radical SAM protein [Elusimicrobiota bacterium]
MSDPIADRLKREGLWDKLANYLAVEAQMKAKSRDVSGKPYWLTVDPTNFCQLKCPFCPTGAGREVRQKASLRLEHFEHIMDALGPTLIHIDFMNWGEPLLNKDLYAMISMAKRHKIDTMVSTNFNAFSEEAAEKMVRCGLDRLVLSIDGLSQQTYEKYRVGGDYSRVVSHLKMLVAKRRELGAAHPRIAWQFLVFKHNEHEIDLVRETALALGVDEVGITPAYMPFKPGIRENWIPTRREYSMYDAETFPDSPPWQWERARTEKEVEVKVYKEAEKRELCNWPWAGIAINPDGSVSPCCSVEEQEYDFGNFFSGPFMELWNNENYRRARDHVARWVEGKTETLPNSKHACERCFSIGKSRFQMPQSCLDGPKEKIDVAA